MYSYTNQAYTNYLSKRPDTDTSTKIHQVRRGTMRFPSLFRRSSRLNDEAKETVQRHTADVKRVEKDEKTMASVERSSSNVSGRVEADSVSTQGSPALVASMLVDKLPHEYERENAVLGHARSTTTHKSTRRDFMDKLLSLSQQHINEIPEMRRATLLRRSATSKSRSTCDPRNTMQVTPAVPTTEELKHMEALRAKGVVSGSSNNFFSPFEGKTDEEIADTATVMFLCVGCGPSLGEGLFEIEDGYTPMDVPVQTQFSGGTVQWGPSTEATTLTTPRTPAEESLDRIFANLAESTVDDEIVLRPPVCGRKEDLVQNRVMLAQKEHSDQSWGGSTISSRVTNYVGQFNNTE